MLAGMRLLFGSEDESRFITARESLLERFERWLVVERVVGDTDAAAMAVDAGLALDWKWSYGDGHLGRWRTEEVAEFLLEWCPRKLSMSPADSLSIPPAVAALTQFLEAQDLLAPGSSPVAALADAVLAVSDEFVAAMGDPSNFGLAKSLFGAAAADGADLADPDRLKEWMDEFNARPEEERRRILPDTAMAPSRRPAARPALPPVLLPGEPEAAASKAVAPILAMFARFAEFVGHGRKLTQAGNLTLADARALVELLGTGDDMDAQIGDRIFKTRSSAELPRLRQVFAWARKAGVVRVVHGRVVATKRGLGVGRDPSGCFDHAVDALFAIGPLASQRDPDWWLAWPDVNELLDRFAVHLLAGPYVTQGPLPIDEMADVAVDAVLEAFEFPSLDDDQVARRVATDVIDIMDALELAGIVRRAGVVAVEKPDDLAGRRRLGGCVELTPAGVAAAHRLLVAAGYDAPTAGRFSEASATELLLATDLDDFPVWWGEMRAWCGRRDAADAARELARAALELEDPALRNLALAVLGDLDLEIAGAEVRNLATVPGARGFALCWLVDHGLEDPKALFDPDDVSWFVDVLAHRLVTAGPDGLCETLALVGNHDRQIAVLAQLWRSPSRATDGILAAVGELHPAKIVAKAARKARFQRRSWLAG